MVCSTDRSGAVVPVLVLFCCFVVYSTRRFVLCLSFCYLVFCILRSFFHCATSLWSEGAGGGGGGAGGKWLILVLLYVCSACACLVVLVFSSSWYLGGAAVCDCGNPWTFSLNWTFSLTVSSPEPCSG